MSSNMEKSGFTRNSYVHAFLGFLCVLAVFFFFALAQLNYNFRNWTPVYLEENITSDEQDIFFLETSEKTALTLRDACSIESAALHNPQKAIRLFSLMPMNVTVDGHMQTLNNISNVHIVTFNLSDVFRDTPLDKLHRSGKFGQSAYPIHHMSDAVRLALMWKLGGIYLDTDVITLRPLSGLDNALGLEYDEDVANGVLFFHKHNPFVKVCMTEFANDYQPGAWGHQGPVLITRVLKNTCNSTRLADVINRPESCQGIRLMPQHSFLPVGWRDWKMIVRGKDLKRFNLTGSYMLHFYGSLSHTTTVKTGNGVLLDVLARKNCPKIYRWMEREKVF